jgi:hypothetical protein
MALTKPSFKYRIVHKAIDRHNRERREVWAYEASLMPPIIVEVPVSQESERSCKCVLIM